MLSEASGPQPKGWHDDPIKAVDQDRFNRAPVAERIAKLIHLNHSVDSSIVYGLEGPWGCGKSSAIALISIFLKRLQRSKQEWRVVSFTPWATAGIDGMLSEFFAVLSSAVPDIPKKNRKRFRKLLAEYMWVVRSAGSFIPMVGGVIGSITRAIEDKLQKQKPWKVLFEELSDGLRELNSPILIIVDDIDRLQVDELLVLLKLVRLLGRFPGVDFLLAYDEQTLVDVLQSSGREDLSQARARAFMEKIVQYPLTLPPLLGGQIVKLISDGLSELLLDKMGRGFEYRRISNIILKTMPSQLSTPRAIERFFAQLREEFIIHVPGEIDDTDLVLAVFLRVKFPDVFSQLQDWKTRLTAAGGSQIVSTSSKKGEVDWNPLVQSLECERDKKDALILLEAIFPAVGGTINRPFKSPRFANPEYFDRYLAQGVPAGDIPDETVRRALSKAVENDLSELKRLFDEPDEARLNLILSKINAHYPDVVERSKRDGPRGPLKPILLEMAMEWLESIPYAPWVVQAPYLALLRWASALLHLLLEEDPDVNLDHELGACKLPDRRLEVISLAAERVEGLEVETISALKATLDRECRRLVPEILANLCERDNACPDIRMALLLKQVLASLERDKLIECVRRGLKNSEFTPQDVAARLVGLSYYESSGFGAVSFDGNLFTQLTDIPARSIDYTPHSPLPSNDWVYRREFAAPLIEESGASTVEQKE